MQQFCNFTLRATAGAIGICLAIVSAYFTAIYMYDLGKGVGLGRAFQFAGVLLDLGKTLFPVMCFAIWAKGKRFIASVGFALALIVMLTSFYITVSSITQAHNAAEVEASTSVNAANHAALVESTKYKDLKSFIETKNAQLASIQATQQRLLDASFVTKANGMQDDITTLSREISQLHAQLNEITIPNTVQYQPQPLNMMFVVVVAGLIECMASASLILVNAMSTPNVSVGQLPNPVKCEDAKDGSAQAFEPVEPSITNDLDHCEILETNPTVVEAEPNESDDMVEKARVVLLDGATPSERSLQTSLSITRRRAGEILNLLESEGFLTRNARNHRELATS